MPIARFKCRGCQVDVPLDHFETTDCFKVCDPDYAAAVLWSERKHHRFGKRVAGVTDIIGCPRRAAAQQALDYAVDPLDQTALMLGTGWHGMVEAAVEDTSSDLFKDVEVEVEGIIDGVKVSGQVDRLYPKRGIISDWKCKSDFSAGKKDGDIPREDYVAQLVIGAELTAQTQGWRPTIGVIRQVFMVKGQAPLVVDPLPSLDSVLGTPMLGGTATLREKLHWAGRWAAGAVAWSAMPLHGETEYFGGKTRCDYCSLQPECWTQAKGASF